MPKNYDMPEEAQESKDNDKEDITIISILSGLDKIDEDDITNFRNRIQPEALDIFDRAGEDDKNMLVLLDSCSDEELVYLMRHDKYKGRALAIHDINQHLFILEGLLYNNRSERLKSIIRSERRKEILEEMDTLTSSLDEATIEESKAIRGEIKKLQLEEIGILKEDIDMLIISLDEATIEESKAIRGEIQKIKEDLLSLDKQ